ncbi:MAG TPA: extracellular solute-binding protein [Nocardioides sp.]|uniref:extracellular solute-binding protein n=1 Tax=Nocardioides sp. TaxID=35761 RepID=UPI002D809AF6|nr:extracellular solute-binding protein [Nocardioides sp.]HET6651223.1 extracellular solute-binding protein [Nocardioides sp.]
MDALRRRARRGVAAALVACAVVAGCTAGTDPGGSSSPSPSPTTTEGGSGPTSSDPVTLRLAVYGDAAVRRAWDELAEAFTNANPDIAVEVEHSRTEERAGEKVQAQFAAGDAPDVFVASNAQVAGLAAADQVQPVDQMLEQRGIEFGDSYQRLGLEAFSAEQALQCMPYDVSPLVVFYHPGLVPFGRLVEPDEERPTPETGWTWDQFARAARLMSGEGVKGAYVEPNLTSLMALVRSAGDDVVDDPRDATTLTLADDGTRAALEEILSVVRDKRVTPTPAQLERRDAFTRFTREEIGMVLGTKELVPRLNEIEGLEYDVFPLPRLARDVTVADVRAMCVSADTEQAEAAADLIAYASTGDGAAILAESGAVVPAHLPTLNSLAFTQPGGRPNSVLVFDNAVRRATTTPFVTAWPRVERAIDPEVEVMFYDPVLNLDTLLPRLDARSQRIMAPVAEPVP